MTVSHALLRAWPYLFATAVSILLFFPTWARLFDAWLRWEQTLAHGLPTFLAFLALLIVHPPLPPQSAGPHTRMSGRIPGGILLLITVRSGQPSNLFASIPWLTSCYQRACLSCAGPPSDSGKR